MTDFHDTNLNMMLSAMKEESGCSPSSKEDDDDTPANRTTKIVTGQDVEDSTVPKQNDSPGASLPSSPVSQPEKHSSLKSISKSTLTPSPPRLSPSRVTWKEPFSSVHSGAEEEPFSSFHYEAENPFSGWEHVWDRFISTQDKNHTMQLLRQWISLPTIAVLGDTSCGNSSLLSQLSGIELPSSHQITTKCPVELKMRYSQTRQAIVDIQWKTAPQQKRVRLLN